MITFTVLGVPQPQGSARALNLPGHKHPVVFTDNPKLKAWRKEIGKAARLVHRGDPLTGAVRVCIDFYLPRPQALRGKSKPHITRPDADKLLRGALDAMTGILFVDDSQCVQVKATKNYAPVDGAPCAVIAVTPLADELVTPLFREALHAAV